jgi:biopolymer transport protein ExbD
MNFQKGRNREEPEINLIPMIDVLLVILIFLMITTTYSKFSGLEINLPTADTQTQKEEPNEINVIVTATGELMVNKVPVAGRDVEAIGAALKRSAGESKEPVVIINADAKANFQRVVDVMQASQQAGLPHISFATQQAQH